MTKRKKKVSKMKIAFVLSCIAIPLIQFAVFYVYTNFSAITMAFTNGQGEFSLENFARFGRELARVDSDLRVALKNTMIAFGLQIIKTYTTV